jgi:hypothetical protein
MNVDRWFFWVLVVLSVLMVYLFWRVEGVGWPT